MFSSFELRFVDYFNLPMRFFKRFKVIQFDSLRMNDECCADCWFHIPCFLRFRFNFTFYPISFIDFSTSISDYLLVIKFSSFRFLLFPFVFYVAFTFSFCCPKRFWRDLIIYRRELIMAGFSLSSGKWRVFYWL